MELAIPLAIAGTGAQAVGSVMRGREEARAAAFETQQFKIQEENARIAAKQDEANRREELTNSIETIQALRGARNLSATSPGGLALLEGVTEEAQDDIRTSRLNYLQRADQANRAATMSRRRGKTSLLAGYLGAAEAVGTGSMKLASLGSTSPYKTVSV